MSLKNIHNGLSVVVKSEQDFNKLKEILGSECLYVDFVPNMLEVKTSVVIFSKTNDVISVGSVGSAEYQQKLGFSLIDFSDILLNT